MTIHHHNHGRRNDRNEREHGMHMRPRPVTAETWTWKKAKRAICILENQPNNIYCDFVFIMANTTDASTKIIQVGRQMSAYLFSSTYDKILSIGDIAEAQKTTIYNAAYMMYTKSGSMASLSYTDIITLVLCVVALSWVFTYVFHYLVKLFVSLFIVRVSSTTTYVVDENTKIRTAQTTHQYKYPIVLDWIVFPILFKAFQSACSGCSSALALIFHYIFLLVFSMVTIAGAIMLYGGSDAVQGFVNGITRFVADVGYERFAPLLLFTKPTWVGTLMQIFNNNGGGAAPNQ